MKIIREGPGKGKCYGNPPKIRAYYHEVAFANPNLWCRIRETGFPSYGGGSGFRGGKDVAGYGDFDRSGTDCPPVARDLFTRRSTAGFRIRPRSFRRSRR